MYKGTAFSHAQDLETTPEQGQKFEVRKYVPSCGLRQDSQKLNYMPGIALINE